MPLTVVKVLQTQKLDYGYIFMTLTLNNSSSSSSSSSSSNDVATSAPAARVA